MSNFIEGLSNNYAIFLLLPVSILLVLAFHEAGHFLAARLLNMRVERVVLGTGRKIWSHTDKTGTQWFIHFWPIRAYVDISSHDLQGHQANWKHILVILSGPLANLILPFFLFVSFFAVFGKPVAPPIITGIDTIYPAYKAGLLPGDRILTIDDHIITRTSQISPLTRPEHNKPLNIKIQRGENILNFEILPEWLEYTDNDGYKQKYSVIGILLQQQPFSFEALKSVAGKPTTNNDTGRELLLNNLGQSTIIGLKSTDNTVHNYLVNLDEEVNEHLLNANHDDYDNFFVGKLKDNHYMPIGIAPSILESIKMTGMIIRNTAQIPFQLFPPNKDLFSPGAIVSSRTGHLTRNLYLLIFFTSFFSVIVGFINFLPFPHLDGSILLITIAETITGEPLSLRKKTILMGGVLLLIYLCIFATNAFDIHDYIEFKIERFSNQNQD